jgi:hypothetical protein
MHFVYFISFLVLRESTSHSFLYQKVLFIYHILFLGFSQMNLIRQASLLRNWLYLYLFDCSMVLYWAFRVWIRINIFNLLNAFSFYYLYRSLHRIDWALWISFWRFINISIYLHIYNCVIYFLLQCEFF